jgi:hypothetical protein
MVTGTYRRGYHNGSGGIWVAMQNADAVAIVVNKSSRPVPHGQ